MIIHRLASAIRHQKWSQIITEILIVVIGIFLGLQVTNWAEDQALRGQEQIYLNQLHEEMTDAMTIGQRRLLTSTRANNRLLEINTYFAQGVIQENFNNEYCNAIRGSSFMFNPTLPLTTLTEIVSSGQLAIFQDQKIRSMISNYMFRLELIASNNDRRRANVENLSVMYPELIKRGALITTAPNRTLQRDQCDFSAMMKQDRKSVV